MPVIIGTYRRTFSLLWEAHWVVWENLKSQEEFAEGRPSAGGLAHVKGDIPPMELSAPGAKDLGRGGGHGTWPTLGLPRAHSIHSQITTLILHHEMVQVNHLVLTAVLCITAAICSTHRELKRLVQRHTAVNAEHAFLCEQVYPCISSTHIVRMPGTCPEELSGWEETNLWTGTGWGICCGARALGWGWCLSHSLRGYQPPRLPRPCAYHCLYPLAGQRESQEAFSPKQRALLCGSDGTGIWSAGLSWFVGRMFLPPRLGAWQRPLEWAFPP